MFLTTRCRSALPAFVGAFAAIASAMVSCPPTARAGDAPMWGHDASRNMVSPEKNLPTMAGKAEAPKDGAPYSVLDREADPAAVKNLKWAVQLGSNTFGNPTVAGGRVYVGTNNEHANDPKYAGDYGILLCLDEATGKLLWQLAVPKLPGGTNVDYEEQGICSPVTVDPADPTRAYLVTNRCEVVCLDTGGLANGNEGVQDEAQYTAGPGRPPIAQGPADADVVWRYDMRHELGVVPHFMTSSSVLVVGDRLYATTSNGVDFSDKHVPAPYAPSLICLDRKTGKLLGEERSGISGRTLYCNWSSPAHGNVGGKPTIVFGGGDGWCYGFDPEPTAGPDGVAVLKELWKVDCNPPEYREKDGKPLKYRDPTGFSEIVATPVVHEGRVYVGIGQDPEHGFNADTGALNCIGAKEAAGPVGLLWRTTKIGRTMSTVSIAGGLLFVADGRGIVYCIDPQTGNTVWSHDPESAIWGCTLVADGKVYAGTESGELVILAADRELKLVARADFRGTIYATPVAANGVLYVVAGHHLYALQQK